MYQQFKIDDLNSKGFIEIKNFFDESLKNEILKEVEEIIEIGRDHNLVLTDSKLNNYTLGNLDQKESFKNIIEKIFEFENLKFEYKDKYRVLRILNGKESDSDNKNFHFDGYHLTCMFPLIIPHGKEKDNGNFFLIPNLRKIFKNKILNLTVKFLYQNKLAKLFYKTSLFTFFFKPLEIKPLPDSLFIFRGFNSLHGSGNLGKNKKRVTLLYHFLKLK